MSESNNIVSQKTHIIDKAHNAAIDKVLEIVEDTILDRGDKEVDLAKLKAKIKRLKKKIL